MPQCDFKGILLVALGSFFMVVVVVVVVVGIE